MIYIVSKPEKDLKGEIVLTTSKSESNRLLIVQALCKEKFEIRNLAEAHDTKTLKEILIHTASGQTANEYNVGPAGTTMRFLTAYFTLLPGIRILTGSERMKERPIKILVDALRQIGANITYLEKEGYPPLKITGGNLTGNEIEMDGSVSSQFITALLLIAPVLPKGLTIRFKGECVSRPYILMTINILKRFKVKTQWIGNRISIQAQAYKIEKLPLKGLVPYYTIEADWSSASYWYSMAALAEEVDITIRGLEQNSLQGDAIVSDIFNFFGVKTDFISGGIRLSKNFQLKEQFGYDFSDCPDVAQTAAVVAAALKIAVVFSGLGTLRIKETDRIRALQTELGKLKIPVREIKDATIEIKPAVIQNPKEPVKTYDDHRMAMAFAPLAYKLNEIAIEDPEVVKKSYPEFWNDLRSVGFVIKEA